MDEVSSYVRLALPSLWRQGRAKDCSTSSSNPMMEGPWCRFRREARARERHRHCSGGQSEKRLTPAGRLEKQTLTGPLSHAVLHGSPNLFQASRNTPTPISKTSTKGRCFCSPKLSCFPFGLSPGQRLTAPTMLPQLPTPVVRVSDFKALVPKASES